MSKEKDMRIRFKRIKICFIIVTIIAIGYTLIDSVAQNSRLFLGASFVRANEPTVTVKKTEVGR